MTKVKFKNTVSARKAKKARENVRGVLVVETEEAVVEAEAVANVVAAIGVIVAAIVAIVVVAIVAIVVVAIVAIVVVVIAETVVTRVKITRTLLEAKIKVKEAKTIGDVEIAAEEVAKEILEGKKSQKLKIRGQTQEDTGVVVEVLQVIKLTAVVEAVAEASLAGEVEEVVVATRTTLDMVMEAIVVVDAVDVEMEVDVEVVVSVAVTVAVTVVAIVVAVVVTVAARVNLVHHNEDIWFNARKFVANQIKTSELSMNYDIAKFFRRLKLNVSCG